MFSLKATGEFDSGYVSALVQYDDQTILGGYETGKILAWNRTDGSFLYPLPHIHTDVITSLLTMTVDGQHVAISGSYDANVLIWTDSNALNITTPSFINTLIVLNTTKSANWIAVANGVDHMIRIYDVQVVLSGDGSLDCLIATLSGNSAAIYALVQLNQAQLVTGSVDRLVKVFSIDNSGPSANLTYTDSLLGQMRFMYSENKDASLFSLNFT